MYLKERANSHFTDNKNTRIKVWWRKNKINQNNIKKIQLKIPPLCEKEKISSLRGIDPPRASNKTASGRNKSTTQEKNEKRKEKKRKERVLALVGELYTTIRYVQYILFYCTYKTLKKEKAERKKKEKEKKRRNPPQYGADQSWSKF